MGKGRDKVADNHVPLLIYDIDIPFELDHLLYHMLGRAHVSTQLLTLVYNEWPAQATTGSGCD